MSTEAKSQTTACNCRQPGLGGDCDGSCQCPQTEDDHIARFCTTDTEIVFEHGVGLTIHAHRAAPWFSWQETKDLSEWLSKMIQYE